MCLFWTRWTGKQVVNNRKAVPLARKGRVSGKKNSKSLLARRKHVSSYHRPINACMSFFPFSLNVRTKAKTKDWWDKVGEEARLGFPSLHVVRKKRGKTGEEKLVLFATGTERYAEAILHKQQMGIFRNEQRAVNWISNAWKNVLFPRPPFPTNAYRLSQLLHEIMTSSKSKKKKKKKKKKNEAKFYSNLNLPIPGAVFTDNFVLGISVN